MTETITTTEGRAYVFVAVDHCSGEFVGIHAASGANRWEALEPVRQGVTKHFGSLDADGAKGLVLRHDHGSNYMSDDFRREIRFLGITSSPAFVRQPEGNGVAERAIRTLKEQLLWIRHFATIEELRLALTEFAAFHNANWLRERHGYRTPDQIRTAQTELETEAATKFRSAARPAQSAVSKPCPGTGQACRDRVEGTLHHCVGRAGRPGSKVWPLCLRSFSVLLSRLDWRRTGDGMRERLRRFRIGIAESYDTARDDLDEHLEVLENVPNPFDLLRMLFGFGDEVTAAGHEARRALGGMSWGRWLIELVVRFARMAMLAVALAACGGRPVPIEPPPPPPPPPPPISSPIGSGEQGGVPSGSGAPAGGPIERGGLALEQQDPPEHRQSEVQGTDHAASSIGDTAADDSPSTAGGTALGGSVNAPQVSGDEGGDLEMLPAWFEMAINACRGSDATVGIEVHVVSVDGIPTELDCAPLIREASLLPTIVVVPLPPDGAKVSGPADLVLNLLVTITGGLIVVYNREIMLKVRGWVTAPPPNTPSPGRKPSKGSSAAKPRSRRNAKPRLPLALEALARRDDLQRFHDRLRALRDSM